MKRALITVLSTGWLLLLNSRAGDIEQQFAKDVLPFVQEYCGDCHDADTKKAELDLSVYRTVDSVLKDPGHWELVLQRLHDGDMPPKKSKHQPTEEIRKKVIGWIETLREREATRNAGDPGPLPARRLSNAEYDRCILDLTGVDIRPTHAFPVDPANQAGFDNSAESLAMSPALVKKYLQAAQEVAEHMVLTPDDLLFASHPVMAETDRDKWAVFRIVDFYRRQPTDYADYFMAAWRYQHRKSRRITLEQIAAESGISAKYLALVHATLSDPTETVGPIAKLQATWRALPAPKKASTNDVHATCVAMRDYVVQVRNNIVPKVENLKVTGENEGAQPLVLWKDRQMAANRRRFDPTALRTNGTATATNLVVAAASTNVPAKPKRRRDGHVQAPTPDIVKTGGVAIAAAFVTKETSATARMAAAKKRGDDPELVIPSDPSERARYEAAFAKFANVFPDAFYITERGRVFLDAEKEQENSGRLLSAGFHNMTGYFRDDGPLYDLILDDAGRKELDRLWNEFDMAAAVPQRMHASFVWAERVDSVFMRDAEFDAYRSEDKTLTTREKISGLSEVYLAKARRNGASDVAQQAIRDHFLIVATNVAKVDALRAASEPLHLKKLQALAERAYRRPLSPAERDELMSFYHDARTENGLDHEDAVRDCVARVLVSPKFLFRLDLVDAAGRKTANPRSTDHQTQPLSDYALASRLSFFLWAGMPDERLLALAASGDLSKPKVLRAETKRMLKDERIRNLATEFAANWLDVRRFEQLNSVDRERFPEFNNELRTAMFEEPLRFFTDIAQHDRPILDMVYGKDTFVNAALAKHYGIPATSEMTNGWVRIADARAYGRGGVMPMAAFLTVNSPGLRTSPVKRGNWVVKRILGERIPPPPAQVPELPKDEKAMGELTLRQALEKHRTREGCMECHARFDSFGLVFEAFGPIGERRAVDLGGRPVDTHAEFPGGSQGDGLDGLVNYIRANRQKDFLDNFCRKLLAYGLGRTLILSDEPLVRAMRAKLDDNGYRLSSLVETIVTSPQFLTTRSQSKVARN